MSTLVVRNARIFDGARVVRGAVVVEGTRIAALTSDAAAPAAETVIDAKGALVVPGAVDLHVHFRDPGFTDKEDFTTGSAAAALGGVTTVLDMPNTRPAVLDAATLTAKRAHLEGRSYVDFGLIAAADGSNVDKLGELAEAGAAAFKLFLYERKDAPPAGVTDDAVILDLLSGARETRLRVHVHAENDAIVKAGKRHAPAPAERTWLDHLKARPWIAEAEAISRAVLFAGWTGTPLHVCHLSSAAGADIVRRAKEAGQRVTAEVTPQHVLLDSRSYDSLGADLVMVPPVREPDDRQALAAALAAGIIDVVATDHAPHTTAGKTGDPLEISTGLVGVQWSYPLLLTEAFAGRLPLSRVVDAMSSRPARLLGLAGRKGVVAPGADADLVLVDELDTRLSRDDLASKGRSTPFDGSPVGCRIRTTVVGGRLQVVDGELVGEPTGSFLAPERERVS